MFQALFSVLISSQPLGQHAIRGLDTNHYSTFSPLHRVTPMLVSVCTLLWSKSGHCRLGEDDGGDGASRVELQDMSSPSVNAVDQQKLTNSCNWSIRIWWMSFRCCSWQTRHPWKLSRKLPEISWPLIHSLPRTSVKKNICVNCKD